VHQYQREPKRENTDGYTHQQFFATLECELLERRRFASLAEAKMACFCFIEGWYNPARLHSALGYRSPMAYEHAVEVPTNGSVINQARQHSTKTGQLQVTFAAGPMFEMGHLQPNGPRCPMGSSARRVDVSEVPKRCSRKYSQQTKAI
jgi:hypothetical protein